MKVHEISKYLDSHIIFENNKVYKIQLNLLSINKLIDIIFITEVFNGKSFGNVKTDFSWWQTNNDIFVFKSNNEQINLSEFLQNKIKQYFSDIDIDILETAELN